MSRIHSKDEIENTSLQKYIYKHAFFHLMMNDQTVEILNLIKNPSFFSAMVQSFDTFIEPFNYCRIMEEKSIIDFYENEDLSTITIDNLQILGAFFVQCGWNILSLRYLDYLTKQRESLLGKNHEDTLSALELYSDALLQIGQYTLAEKKFRNLFDTYKKQFGPEDPKTIEMHNNIGVVLLELGQLQEAEDIFSSVCETFSKILGVTDKRTIISCCNLLNVYKEQRKLDLALQLCEENERNIKEAFGSDHPLFLQNKNLKGNIYFYGGELEKTHKEYSEVIQKGITLFGESHPMTLVYKNNLHMLEKSQGDYETSLKGLQDIYKTNVSKRGKNNAFSQLLLENIGVVLHHSRKYIDAKKVFDELIEIRTKQYGELHFKTISSTFWLGLVLFYQGNFIQTEKIVLTVVEKWKKTLGPTHNQTLEAQSLLLWTYSELGNTDGISQQYQNIIQQRTIGCGKMHHSTLRSILHYCQFLHQQEEYETCRQKIMKNLQDIEELMGKDCSIYIEFLEEIADMEHSLENYQQSITLYSDVLDLCNSFFGANASNTLQNLNRYAGVLYDAGETELARENYQKCLDLRLEFLGEEHTDTIVSLHNLAWYYRKHDRYDLAEELYKKSLRISRKILGAKNWKTISTVNSLGVLYVKMKRYNDALPLYKEYYESTESMYGSTHPDTIVALSNLAWLYIDMQSHNPLDLFEDLVQCYTSKDSWQYVYAKLGLALCRDLANAHIKESNVVKQELIDILGSEHDRVKQINERIENVSKWMLRT